jgi:hypothetical protein
MSHPSWPIEPPEASRPHQPSSDQPAPAWPQPPPAWPQPPHAGWQQAPPPGWPQAPPPGWPQAPPPGWPQPAPQPSWDQPQQQPWPPTYPASAPPPKKSRTGLIILIIPIAVLVLVGLGVAAYVWSADRIQAARTWVEAPTSLVGRPKITEPQLVAMVDQLAAQVRQRLPNATSTAVGLYGEPAELDVVVLAAVAGRVADPAKQLTQTFEGVSTAGLSASGITSVDPGPLGGEARCGTVSAGPVSIVLCAWADPGSLGIVGYYFQQDVDEVAAEFVRARGEVEKRG